MIRTVFSDRTEDKKKIFTAYDTNYKPVWYSKEYRFDTELVKQTKDYLVLRTILGYEAYKIEKVGEEFISSELDYKIVMTQEEINEFDKYYKSIHPNANHPEIDLTPEESYRMLDMANSIDESRQILDEKLLRNDRIIKEQENELNEMKKELEQLKKERDLQTKKVHELEQTAYTLNLNLRKSDQALICKLKEYEKRIKEYEDFYGHWAEWYKKNKIAIQTLKHEKMIKTAIILMIINIFIVISIL